MTLAAIVIGSCKQKQVVCYLAIMVLNTKVISTTVML
jgi:hypothetical protein